MINSSIYLVSICIRWLFSYCLTSMKECGYHYGTSYAAIAIGELFVGINPFTGEQVTVDNIKALFLFNNSNKTVTFGYGSSVALLTIVR